MCHGASACARRPARGEGGRVQKWLGQRCKTTKFAFARTRTVSVLPPAWRPCLAAGRPVCDRFLIIHTGGSVHGVMASDRPHMSVCVDQALCADRNEPSG